MAESHYCPMCGVPHGGEADADAIAEVDAVEEITRADVEIARINADKEIRLAKIAAGVEDQERNAELAHAEGRAEGMQEALDTITPDPEPVPVIVDAPVVEPDPEPIPDVLPPPVDDHQADESKRKRSSHGMSQGWFG